MLLEPNVNDYELDDPHGFDHGNIWFDVSGVDGINANMELKYGEVDRKIFVPLFETKVGDSRHGKLDDELFLMQS
jgi:hypothetical protein